MTKAELNLFIQDVERDPRLTPEQKTEQTNRLHTEYSSSPNMAKRHMDLRYRGVTERSQETR